MKYVIGTAGHVDHGKSALVESLTGINPDRLIEEKQRQMTIDLGFAWLDLPGEREVGIVDVPGHSDFIKNMLAGVGGIDAVILVIAADEGIMPQTREHINILNLLNIQNGLVVISKIDLAENDEWLNLIEKDIKNTLFKTNLKTFPIIRVSVLQNQGINELKTELGKILENTKPKKDNHRPRLPIDRVFTIKGFGTVITGTLLDGKLNVGDDIIISPGKIKGRIRGLQTHKSKLDVAEPGSRVAVNLSGIDTDSIERGQVLHYPQQYQTTTRFDAEVRMIPETNTSLKHDDQVKLNIGTVELNARVRVIGDDKLSSNQSGFVQIETEEPIMVFENDRFILRRPSPAQTIGGGKIIKVNSTRRYKRFNEEILQELNALSINSLEDLITIELDKKQIISLSELSNNLAKKTTLNEDLLDHIQTNQKIIKFEIENSGKIPEIFLTTNQYLKDLSRKIVEMVNKQHTENPMYLGLSTSDIEDKIKLPENILKCLIKEKFLSGDLIVENNVFRLKEHSVTYSDQDEKKLKELNSLIDETPFTPPEIEKIITLIGNKLWDSLLQQKLYIKVSKEIAFRYREFELMKNKLMELLKSNGEITLAQFRDTFDSSRKYTLAFLEYMDKQGLTYREGNVRKLKNRLT